MNRTERLKHFKLNPEDTVNMLLTVKYMNPELQNRINNTLNMPPSTEYYIALERSDWLYPRIIPKNPDIRLRLGQLYRLSALAREYFFTEGIITTHPCTPFEIKQVINKLTRDIPELSKHINPDEYGK
ncbi:MAG: hypothetical protein NC548_51970 [Lachnospiraceae bacterium]|nr:hypothetical protein [Lachnospiraceae bacterium]